jgi:hypothetical protein
MMVPTSRFKVSSTALEEPWEGLLEDLLAVNEDLPELVRRRVLQMQVGELRRLAYHEATFVVERIA